MTLYIGVEGEGVFKSTNGGDKWFEINTGLTYRLMNVLTNDPQNTSTLYLGTPGSGAFKSTNGGENWIAINKGKIDKFVNTLTVDPIKSTILYAGTSRGIYKSIDGGSTWIALKGFSSFAKKNLYGDKHKILPKGKK